MHYDEKTVRALFGDFAQVDPDIKFLKNLLPTLLKKEQIREVWDTEELEKTLPKVKFGGKKYGRLERWWRHHMMISEFAGRVYARPAGAGLRQSMHKEHYRPQLGVVGARLLQYTQLAVDYYLDAEHYICRGNVVGFGELAKLSADEIKIEYVLPSLVNVRRKCDDDLDEMTAEDQYTFSWTESMHNRGVRVALDLIGDMDYLFVPNMRINLRWAALAAGHYDLAFISELAREYGYKGQLASEAAYDVSDYLNKFREWVKESTLDDLMKDAFNSALKSDDMLSQKGNILMSILFLYLSRLCEEKAFLIANSIDTPNKYHTFESFVAEALDTYRGEVSAKHSTELLYPYAFASVAAQVNEKESKYPTALPTQLAIVPKICEHLELESVLERKHFKQSSKIKKYQYVPDVGDRLITLLMAKKIDLLKNESALSGKGMALSQEVGKDIREWAEANKEAWQARKEHMRALQEEHKAFVSKCLSLIASLKK